MIQSSKWEDSKEKELTFSANPEGQKSRGRCSSSPTAQSKGAAWAYPASSSRTFPPPLTPWSMQTCPTPAVHLCCALYVLIGTLGPTERMKRVNQQPGTSLDLVHFDQCSSQFLICLSDHWQGFSIPALLLFWVG